ncbi:MAG: hypothetical protein J0M29_07620 [Chitinophagales bacterium]|nr:hypothetical protein [Chitinophagales bacterium]
MITDKYEREIEKGNGILQIKVTESNITHYDMRGKEPYLCYINGDTAFFYVNIREAKIGDTILVNTNSNFVYNTKGELSFIKQLIVWDPYWEKVKKSGY